MHKLLMIYKVIFQALLPLFLIFLLIASWVHFDEYHVMIIIGLSIFFIIGPHKSLTIISIYQKQSHYELIVSVILLYIYMIQRVNKSNEDQGLFEMDKRIEFIYLLILNLNLYTYLFSFIIMLLIGLLVISQSFTGHDLQIMDINMNGLSKKQLKKIRTIRPQQIDHTSNPEILCGICLEDMNLETNISEIPICKHIFHQECINHWLSNNVLCPFCRSNIRNSIKSMDQKYLEFKKTIKT